MSQAATSHIPGKAQTPLRFITAASLFDGHDASINIMRRMLQASGVEVVHLGHNRSVAEIVAAAVQEDVQGIAISSYQGGHVEYFQYMIDCLREQGAERIQVFGGGGGVIIPEEIAKLHDYGVARIYSPQDGQTMGLQGMIDHMINQARVVTNAGAEGVQSDSIYNELFSAATEPFETAAHWPLASLLTAIENNELASASLERLHAQAAKLENPAPVLGITGTGGSGKSSV
ncbi:MAG: methylmalonyl-CoA mutase, partial [Pseudomonadales bacterium]